MPNIFITKYPPREPQLRSYQNTPPQLEQLTETHGVYPVNDAPATWATVTEPPTFEKARDGSSLYLWIITNTPPTVRCIKEHEERALTDERNRACHTNLTGGQPACAGGEMWFSCPDTIYLNGWSGRYPVQSEEQLRDAALVFTRKGYRVGSLGFSQGTGQPRRVVRPEEIEWFPPQISSNK